MLPVSQKKGCEYKFHTEFQSHEPEFVSLDDAAVASRGLELTISPYATLGCLQDYLKSLEIEEKINKIKWCRRQNASHFLLSTNGEWAQRGGERY